MNKPQVLRWVVSATALCASSLAAHAQDVNVSIGVSQPGFYGRIDVGNAPPPPVIYAQPVIITPSPYSHVRRPIYMRVPPGQEREWGRYCAHYAACNQPVYFVRDQDRGREHEDRDDRHERHDEGRHRGHGHGHDRDHGHDDDRH